MKTIAERLKEEMIKSGTEIVWAGKVDICTSAYIGKIEHPLNRIKAVIDAARRSNIFEHCGYIRAMDSKSKREILHPCFKIR